MPILMQMPEENAFWNSLPLSSAGYRMGLAPTERWLTPASTKDRNFKTRLLREHRAQVLQIRDNIHSATVSAEIAGALNAGVEPDFAQTALAVRDDLCIVDRRDVPTLIAACVCSPSYWRLADKIGRPIRDVHGNVPGLNAALGERIDAFFRRLPEGRIFERRNWFVHTSNERFQPDPSLEVFDGSELFLRSERQTLRAFGDAVLFGIDVTLAPLAEIRTYPKQHAAMVSALEALDGAELEHFGGWAKRAAVLEFLIARSQPGE